jgi:hypothetical protein
MTPRGIGLLVDIPYWIVGLMLMGCPAAGVSGVVLQLAALRTAMVSTIPTGTTSGVSVDGSDCGVAVGSALGCFVVL